MEKPLIILAVLDVIFWAEFKSHNENVLQRKLFGTNLNFFLHIN